MADSIPLVDGELLLFDTLFHADLKVYRAVRYAAHTARVLRLAQAPNPILEDELERATQALDAAYQQRNEAARNWTTHLFKHDGT